MKWLILILLVPVTNLMADGEVASIDDLSKGIASNIRDVEVDNLVVESAEFRECRDLYPFDAADDRTKRSDKLKKAEDCIRKKMVSNPERLKELSASLRLQDFGLVKGKAVTDIQKYFNRKMTKALTGVDPEEQDRQKILDDLKWGRKKVVDQSIFFDLYSTQLTKSALYEVSRFCFQNFRIEGQTSPNNFGEYWKDFSSLPASTTFTDTGNPVFGDISDPSDKTKIYQDILGSVNVGKSNSLPTNQLESFFKFCGGKIRSLCDGFKNKVKPVDQNREASDSVIDNASTTSGSGSTAGNVGIIANNSTTSNGAEACLSLNRLQTIRVAIEDVKKVKDGIKDLEVGPEHMQALFSDKPARLFKAGEDGAEDIDNLTISSSKDILEGDRFNAEDKKLDDCINSPTDFDKCQNYITNKETLEKTRQRIELEGTIAREVELARLKKAKDDQKLEDYLKENGYFDLIEKMKGTNGPAMSADQIVEEVLKELEARKIATIEALNKKLGSRQASEDDPTSLQTAANAIKQTKEERARLAQVVLFNNVITSHLDLIKSGQKESAGKNVNAWKREERDLGDAVDKSFFENMAASSSGSSQGASGANEIGGLGLIENILGKPPE